jgi:DNA-binding NarL/FixJ family response regulator
VKATVLICDDAVAYGNLFGLWLRAMGIEDIAHATTVHEALALAEKLQPALVVVDHLLPDGSSDVLVPRLRAVSPAAKVLLVSGMPEDRLAAAAAAVEADGYVTKASSAQAVRDAVARLLA